MKIKVNDKILVTAGKYKGKIANVMRVYEKTNRITVEKVNIRTRHIKKNSSGPGQMIKYEAPFNVSKVSLLCPNCNKTTRVAYSLPKEGKKFRVCVKCGESVEQSIKKIDKKK